MHKKKIVVLFGKAELPDKNAAAQRFLTLAKSFKDIGYEPILLGFNKDHSGQASDIEEFIFNNFKCYTSKYPLTALEHFDTMSSIRQLKYVAHLHGIENIFAIIPHEYEVIALIKMLFFCKKYRINLIPDNVEWFGKSYLKFPQNVIKRLDTFFRMRVIYPLIQDKICISSYLYNYHRSLKRSNIIEIPITVDKNDEKWSISSDYKINKIRTIVFAGNPGPYCSKERIDWLIEASCLVSQKYPIKVKLIGFERIWFENQFPKLTELEGYNDCIEYYGKMNHVDCLKVIRQSDFFSIIREDNIVTKAGFPTKLSEGFACGTPVLATLTSNISDYILPYNVGYVSKGATYDDVVDLVLLAATIDDESLIEMHKNCEKYNELQYSKFNTKIEQFTRECRWK